MIALTVQPPAPPPPAPPLPSLPPLSPGALPALPPLAPIAPGLPDGSIITNGEPFVIIPGPNGNVKSLSFNGREVEILLKNGVTKTIEIDRVVPSGAVDIVQAIGATLLLLIVGFPISRAIARWIDRKNTVPHVPKQVVERMQHMEQTLDDVALQVERISEAQRFTSRLLADERAEAVPLARDAAR